MKSIMSSHKKKVLTHKNKRPVCCCIVKNSCLLDNKCLMLHLIYQVDVTNNLDVKYNHYLELAETTLKERYGNHKSSLRNKISQTKSSFCKVGLTENLFILNALGNSNCHNKNT